MKMIIPLAGKDARFEAKGLCKPLVLVGGIPLIKYCLSSLSWPIVGQGDGLHFIILEEHNEKFGLGRKLAEWYPKAEVHVLGGVTEGAACTVLALEHVIGDDEEVIVYLADISFSGNIGAAVAAHPDAAGIIPVFASNNRKYSYARADSAGRVAEVAEKKTISGFASAGFYFFRRGRDFIDAAKEMIRNGDRVNNAFYICPIYNYLLGKGVYTAQVEFHFDLGSDEFIERWCP